MKIEIFEVDNLTKEPTGLTCFEAPRYIAKKLLNHPKPIYGICIIDNIPIQFYLCPTGLDGDIFTDDSHYRTILKHLIPLWCIEHFEL